MRLPRPIGIYILLAVGFVGFLPQKVCARQGYATGQVIIDSGVEDALSSSGTADVIVAFKTDKVGKSGEIDIERLSREITRISAEIRNSVSSSAFETRQTYTHIPAIAGRILSDAALREKSPQAQSFPL